ncbi:MAG: hypothetical protein OEM39_06565 [Acidimicrobiia bacterium]|nr:hypothetical protein [Acidimicrobiia bacterium]MDH3463089.1 hypothetical protein [Acidimicrobiia bacterium]
MTAVYAIVIVLALVVILMAMLIAGLLRSHAEILRKLEALGMGADDHDHRGSLSITAKPDRKPPSSLPGISGVDPDGQPVTLSPTLGSHSALIAFLSTSCSSCTVFWENLDQPEMVFGGRTHRVIVATMGPNDESPTRAASLRRGKADVVMSTQAWEDYEVPGAPYFVVADPADGILGEGSADTFQALVGFLEDSLNDRRWDEATAARPPGGDREDRIDRELRAAGLEPNDERLHHKAGDFNDA